MLLEINSHNPNAISRSKDGFNRILFMKTVFNWYSYFKLDFEEDFLSQDVFCPSSI